MDISSQTLSKQLGVSRFRIDSWRSGKGPFYLQDLLRIFNQFSHYLAEFSLYFFDLEEVEKIGVDLAEYRLRQFEMERPIISLILRALETRDHIQSIQASTEFVAQVLGLEEEDVKSILTEAVSLGLVTKKGDRYFSGHCHVDLRGRRALKQRRFWIEKSLQFMDEGKIAAPDYIFGNVVYCISQERQNRILDEYLRFYSNIRQIMEGDDGGDFPMVLNFQMLRMNKR